jgi:hypothetical protein
MLKGKLENSLFQEAKEGHSRHKRNRSWHPTVRKALVMLIGPKTKSSNYVNEVCEELGWDGLSSSDWAMLKSIVDLLAPFALYTQLVSGNKYVTFSAAIPTIEELKLHLEASAEVVGLKLVSEAMLADLKRRFDYLTVPSSSNFDPTYLVGTILDPNYNFLVIKDSAFRNVAITNVVKLAKQMGIPYSSKPVSENEMADTATEGRRITEDDVPKNLFQNSFRRLYQKTISANAQNAGSRSSSSLSNISEGGGFGFDNDVQGRCAIER